MHHFLKCLLNRKRNVMTKELTLQESPAPSQEEDDSQGSLLLGTGLVVASMILVPALAMRLGLSASLTGALRIALMKASSRVTHGEKDESGASSSGFSCH